MRRSRFLGVLILLFAALLVGEHLIQGRVPSMEFHTPSNTSLIDQSTLGDARELAT